MLMNKFLDPLCNVICKYAGNSLSNVTKINYQGQAFKILQGQTLRILPQLIRNFSNVVNNKTENLVTGIIPKQKEVKLLSAIKKGTNSDLANNKVFAVVHMAGSQFKVSENDVIMINKKIEADCGELIRLEKILAVGGHDFTFIGQPLMKRELVKITAKVVEKTKGEKKIAFKKKRRKGYKRWKGHRQDLSVIKIENISIDLTHL